MNRRRFLELFGMATVGATVAYSFPNIIVPKNIISPFEAGEDILFHGHIIKTEIYPGFIDNFFMDSPFMSYMRKTQIALSQNIIDEIPAQENEPIFFINSKDFQFVNKPDGISELYGFAN